jgi:hypothetical protein
MLRITGFFGLCPSFSILENRKHKVSETGSPSVLGWGEGETPTMLGRLERANHNHCWCYVTDIQSDIETWLSYEVYRSVNLVLKKYFNSTEQVRTSGNISRETKSKSRRRRRESLHANAWILLEIMSRPLPSTFFPLYSSLSNLSFDATQSEILTASLNKYKYINAYINNIQTWKFLLLY